jgi:hypothetical protein
VVDAYDPELLESTCSPDRGRHDSLLLPLDRGVEDVDRVTMLDGLIRVSQDEVA